MYAPTDHELITLRALIDHGTCKRAAVALGVAEQTVKNTLYNFRLRARVDSTERLVYEYRDDLRALKAIL